MNKKAGMVAVGFAVLLAAWPAPGGQVGGPKTTKTTVLGSETDVFRNIVFEGNTTAQIRITGDHSTNLDCFVFDNSDDKVASDVGDTDTCLLRWTPSHTGKFRLEVKNLGSKPNEYKMETN